MIIKEAVSEGKKILNDSIAADILLAYVLEKKKEFLITHSEDDLNEENYNKYISLIQRHKRGEPVPYLTEFKEFFGLDFYVNKNVLIPRPETEHIVEKIIELVKSDFQNITVKILDVGTGSGNIAVSLANNLVNSQITAVDISKEALAVAEININKYELQDRIKLFQSDLLSCVCGEFDIIVANLPYIGIKENNFIAYEVENYEPHIALFGGDDGLELYSKLFDQIREKKCLRHYLIGEIGFSQRNNLEKLLNFYFPESKFEIFRDLAGFDRYFVVNY